MVITGQDSGGGSVSTVFNMIVENVAPTLTSVSVPTRGTEGRLINLSAVASDPADAADRLTYAWTVTKLDCSVLTALPAPRATSGRSTNGNYGVSLTLNDGDVATRSVTYVAPFPTPARADG